eukprot:g44680.t1
MSKFPIDTWELGQFINFTNTFYHALKFTWAISDTSLPFLDLSISISDSSELYLTSSTVSIAPNVVSSVLGRPNADSETSSWSICALHAPTNLTFWLPSTLTPLVTVG